MAQTFGILGFALSLLAIFFASEVMRRAAHQQNELQTALFKAMARIQKLEGNVFHVEKLAAEIRHQRKRQADTLTSLAKKGEQKGEHGEGSGERFTPSTHASTTSQASSTQAPKRKTG